MAKFSGGLNYGRNLPSKKDSSLPNKKSSAINNFIGDDEVLDLPNISIQNLQDELQSSINKGTPIFLWSKNRLNNKIRLDNEKQILITEKIKILRETVKEANNLKADIFFSQEYIKNLIADNRMVAEHYFQLSIANHQKSLNEIKVKMGLTTSLLDHDDLEKQKKTKENLGIDAENEIKLAQATKIRAEADSIQTQNDLKRIVMSKIDFNNFPPVYTTYLLSVLSGINAEAFTDLDIKERLKEVYINMEKTKAEKAQAEVDDFINSAEFRKWKNNQTKKDAGL